MAKTAYYIPNGPKNLKIIFPALPWADIEEYYIETYTPASALLLATGTKMVIDNCNDDKRIHFLNSAGAIDSASFKIILQEHDVKSGAYEKPTRAPLMKSAHGINRNNIRANTNYIGAKIVLEEDMPYYQELLDSPLAWIEWTGTQGQADDYIPIIITDKKTTEIKEEDRYHYELTVEFKLSHEKSIIRN